MTKQQFNRAVAERAMGHETYPDNDDPSNASKYCYYTPDGLLVDGLDFATDHNAAAMVRGRVGELDYHQRVMFANAIVSMANGGTWMGYQSLDDCDDFIRAISATPAQTARAAYLAVTGEELEAVDE